MKEQPIVLVPLAELRALLADAIAEAVTKAAPRQESEVLNRKQVAALIGRNPCTIPKLVREDGLPTLRRVGKFWRFSRRAVLAWMEQQKADES